MKVPVILLEETSDPQNRSGRADWLLRQYIRLADKIIAISPDVENYLKSRAKIPNQKIILVNNGVVIPQYPNSHQINSKKRDLGLKDEDIVVGFVGRLSNDHKRITDLLEAVSFIGDNRIKVLIVGDGRDRGLVNEKVISYHLTDKVVMAGYQHETSLFYSMMDIFVVPSAREGFGLVAAEAMLHSLPVVASKVGGLKDIVVNNETGYLIPPKEPRILSDKIKDLINDSEKRKLMGEKGYQRAMANFTSDQYCENIRNLYLGLLGDKKISIRSQSDK